MSDNGIGLPLGIDLMKTQTLGLKLVTFLAKHQMRAKIEVNSRAGTEFVFRLAGVSGNSGRLKPGTFAHPVHRTVVLDRENLPNVR